jgi:hypothetical protein
MIIKTKEAAAFHFAPKGLRLFFFEPARLDGAVAAATDLCLSFSDDAPRAGLTLPM